MRILFSFAGGSGHAGPLVPIADTAVQAGHAVAFAGRPSVLTTLDDRFEVFPDEDDHSADRRAIAPLAPVDMRHEYAVLRDAYAGRFARAATRRTLELARRWRADVIVCDEVDFGAMIAAERLTIPHATVLVNASGSFVRRETVTQSLDAIRAQHGLPPDRELAMPARDLVVSPFPPGLRDPRHPLPPRAIAVRPSGASSGADDVPPWLLRPSDRPLAYFTLGTVFNRESGDLFARVTTALGALAIDAVVTVGRDLDVEVIGSPPENVRVERHIPHGVVLSRCDVVVNHAGSGTVVGALAHGLPMVLLPIGADQPLNATRCEELGVGIVLDVTTASSAEIGHAVATVLDDARFGEAAGRMRAEIESLPGPDAAVAALERIARD